MVRGGAKDYSEGMMTTSVFHEQGRRSAAWGPQPKQRTVLIRRLRRLADFTANGKTFSEKQGSASV